jgi:Protein of unknown function (DUF1460)
MALNLEQSAKPRTFNPRRMERLFSHARHHVSVGSRIDVLSSYFLGYPYKANPLIGAADTPEVFTASLDGFDCVTFVETILALSLASKVDEFLEWLRKIRYQQGRIQWERRNHYMTQWIHNNIREGIVRQVPIPALAMVSRQRVLNVVPGLAARRITMNCLPKAALRPIESVLRTGDLVFFASTRKHLDVFHVGIITRHEETVLLRHASRSKGAVVEQQLRAFLKANRMAGVILVRPREIRAGKQHHVHTAERRYFSRAQQHRKRQAGT